MKYSWSSIQNFIFKMCITTDIPDDVYGDGGVSSVQFFDSKTLLVI